MYGMQRQIGEKFAKLYRCLVKKGRIRNNYSGSGSALIRIHKGFGGSLGKAQGGGGGRDNLRACRFVGGISFQKQMG